MVAGLMIDDFIDALNLDYWFARLKAEGVLPTGTRFDIGIRRMGGVSEACRTNIDEAHLLQLKTHRRIIPHPKVEGARKHPP